MSLEAEELLTKVKRVKNVAVDGELKEKAVRFMPPREKEAKKEDLAWVESILSPANKFDGPYQHTMINQDARKNLVGYSRFLKKDLADNVAPPITGETKDALKTRLAFLEDRIKEGMPTHEEQRRCPAGNVAKHTKWEARNKDFILERRNILHALEPNDDSEDLASVEMLRPSMAGPQGMASTFMSDSVIPGVFAMSAQAKENWPLGEPKCDTALAQAERRELEEKIASLEALAALQAEQLRGPIKKVARFERKPPTPWQCPDCDEHMTLRQKGVHIGKHRREAKAAERAATHEGE